MRHSPLAMLLVLLAIVAPAAHAQPPPSVEGMRTEVFYWRVTDIFALTDGGFVFIEQIPEGITSLVGTPAEDLLMLGAFIRNEDDEVVGIGSELEEFHRPLTAAGTHDAVWTLMISGRGSLIAHELEETSKETRAFLEEIRAMDGPWSGEHVAAGTIGPAENRMGVIVGGTGEFAGAQGYMTEENVYLAFDGAEYDVRTRLTFYLED